MRVISGKYKGKKLDGFDIDGTRPTMDRLKESLFAIIQNYIKNSVVLDLFAGSGSLGIEALSMGAKFCYFVDNNKIAIDTINKNLNGVDGATILKDDYLNALKKIKDKNIKFDIVFLDPPYKLNLINKSIESLLNLDLLNKDAIVVCEYENENIKCNLELLKEKKYGNKNIKIYKV